MRRGKLSQRTSAQLVDFLCDRLKLTQEQLADKLELSPAFISRARSGERSFTIEHLHMMEDLLDMPLGAILLAVPLAPRRKPDTPEMARIRDMATKALEAGAELGEYMRRRKQKPAAARRAS
jgi:transcriptional regulator with XRE-family HTH domain